MSDQGMGFGGFLLGLGAGWYLFRYIDISIDTVSYLLILMGLGIILGGLLNRGGRKHPIQEIVGGVVGGLFLALFLTQGFNFIFNITDELDDITSTTYKASELRTLTQRVEADAVSFDVSNVNGAVEIMKWSGDELKIELDIKAKGGTTAEAEKNLAQFKHELDSVVTGGVQEVSLSFPMSSVSMWTLYVVNIDVYVPEVDLEQITVDTTNGEITVQDLTTNILNIDSTNGRITLTDTSSDTMTVHTTNGEITGTITADTGSYSTTNGQIDIDLGEYSGDYWFETTNGAIDINTPKGTDIGVSLTLDTSIGEIDVDLSGIEYEINQARTKIGETADYELKTIQIKINADTTVGEITIK